MLDRLSYIHFLFKYLRVLRVSGMTARTVWVMIKSITRIGMDFSSRRADPIPILVMKKSRMQVYGLRLCFGVSLSGGTDSL